MTKIQEAVAVEATIAQRAWAGELEAVMAEVADCFPRRESRALLRQATEAMLLGLERVNCQTMAEALGHAGPHRLQHFLSRGAWDHDLVRDRVMALVAGELADERAVFVIDETGDEKSSTDAVGAARQYPGALGGVGLCQVAVHLTLAGQRGHTLIDRALYLPAAWAGDDERRELAHVPDELCFATKPELACGMLERARRLGIAGRWVAGDEVYGGRDTRRRVRELGYDYVLAVRADHIVRTPADAFTVTALAGKLPRRAWMRLRTGHGTKGDRHYDWAVIDVLPDDTPGGHPRGGHSALLIRRHRYTRELSFYRCHSATPVALADLVAVVCTRWRIEEDFHTAKDLAGLDHGQTTCWNSWMRWTLISLIATAVLALTRALTRQAGQSIPGLVPVSARELLRILRATVLPQPRRDLGHLLHWSAWRRRHQHRATLCHRRWNNITAAAAP